MNLPRPESDYPRTRVATRIGFALGAIVISSALMATVGGLFDPHLLTMTSRAGGSDA